MEKSITKRLDLEVVDERRNGDDSEKERIEAGRFLRRFFMSSEEVYKTFYSRLCEALDYEP